MPQIPLINLVTRFLYPYGSIRRVLAGPAKGLRFRVAPGMGFSYALGRDHRIAFDFLTKQLTPSQNVYDVGANQGQFSLIFGKLLGVHHVTALEPLQANFDTLRFNLELNQMAEIKTLCKAAGSKTEKRTFSFASHLLTMGTFTDCAVKLGQDTTRTEVECVTLDELIRTGSPAPDVIKIDVEGAAGEVLAGAQELLDRHRPSLFVEMHLSPRQNQECSAIEALIKNHGYKVEMLDGMPFEASRPEGEYQSWCTPLKL